MNVETTNIDSQPEKSELPSRNNSASVEEELKMQEPEKQEQQLVATKKGKKDKKKEHPEVKCGCCSWVSEYEKFVKFRNDTMENQRIVKFNDLQKLDIPHIKQIIDQTVASVQTFAQEQNIVKQLRSIKDDIELMQAHKFITVFSNNVDDPNCTCKLHPQTYNLDPTKVEQLFQIVDKSIQDVHERQAQHTKLTIQKLQEKMTNINYDSDYFEHVVSSYMDRYYFDLEKTKDILFSLYERNMDVVPFLRKSGSKVHSLLYNKQHIFEEKFPSPNAIPFEKPSQQTNINNIELSLNDLKYAQNQLESHHMLDFSDVNQFILFVETMYGFASIRASTDFVISFILKDFYDPKYNHKTFEYLFIYSWIENPEFINCLAKHTFLYQHKYIRFITLLLIPDVTFGGMIPGEFIHIFDLATIDKNLSSNEIGSEYFWTHWGDLMRTTKCISFILDHSLFHNNPALVSQLSEFLLNRVQFNCNHKQTEFMVFFCTRLCKHIRGSKESICRDIFVQKTQLLLNHYKLENHGTQFLQSFCSDGFLDIFEAKVLLQNIPRDVKEWLHSLIHEMQQIHHNEKLLYLNITSVHYSHNPIYVKTNIFLTPSYFTNLYKERQTKQRQTTINLDIQTKVLKHFDFIKTALSSFWYYPNTNRRVYISQQALNDLYFNMQCEVDDIELSSITFIKSPSKLICRKCYSDYKEACQKVSSCNLNDNVDELSRKHKVALECYNLRFLYTMNCAHETDVGHNTQLDDVEKTTEHCEEVIKKKKKMTQVSGGDTSTTLAEAEDTSADAHKFPAGMRFPYHPI